MRGLRRSLLARPGITRRSRGRGFQYADPRGRPLDDVTLNRVRQLAVPPAWREVWISPEPEGHIQAVGLDAAGRRQYIYHPQWTEQRSRDKHRRVLRLAAELPEARNIVSTQIGDTGMGMNRVLAAAFRLLDLGFFRIGSEQYARRNGTYGLATLRREDVKVRGDTVTFSFAGKHGIQVSRRIVDPVLADVLKSLLRRRDIDNPELLAWREGREWMDVKSPDINSYLRTLLKDDFTAKDFRTWHGTVIAAATLSLATPLAPRARMSLTASQRKQILTHAAREVGHHLGNTPAVARKSYIHHGVIENFDRGRVISVASLDSGADGSGSAIHGPVEEETLKLLTRGKKRGTKR